MVKQVDQGMTVPRRERQYLGASPYGTLTLGDHRHVSAGIEAQQTVFRQFPLPFPPYWCVMPVSPVETALAVTAAKSWALPE